MYNLKTALEEHVYTFPEATVESQLYKFNEEWIEFQKADSHEKALSEYGDLLWVLISFRRFPELSIISEELLDKYYFSYPIKEKKTFLKYLDKAINKVKKRNYYFDGQNYQRDKNIYRSSNNG